MKSIVKSLRESQRKQLLKHMPAKDAPILEQEAKDELEEFKQAYDQFLVSSQDTSRSVESDGFHPSALGVASGKCPRRDFYLLRGVEKKGNHSPQLLRIFANGHAVHDRIQKALEGMGVLIEAEVEINYDMPPIRGHADGVLEWKGRRILLEIKSAREEAFSARIKWKKAKSEHTDQANIYAYILGIDTIWVWYENKNDQGFEIFEHKANPEAAEKQIAKWLKTYEMFKAGETPKRPYKPGSPTCAGCDMLEFCMNDPEKGI